MKGNSHKKDYQEDKFARRFYCQHARLNQLRADKKASKRKYHKVGELLAVKQKQAFRKEKPAEETTATPDFNTETPIVSSENEAISTQPTAEEIKEQTTGKKPVQHIVNHKVKQGETIAKIAKRYGVSIEQILRLNNISKSQASRIKIGQILRIK